MTDGGRARGEPGTDVFGADDGGGHCPDEEDLGPQPVVGPDPPQRVTVAAAPDDAPTGPRRISDPVTWFMRRAFMRRAFMRRAFMRRASRRSG
ncbi:MAG: hypothetical protein JWO98_5177 [Frankiales bacterium]|nr:hypothetical protein [Frankiales bacterium]